MQFIDPHNPDIDEIYQYAVMRSKFTIYQLLTMEPVALVDLLNKYELEIIRKAQEDEAKHAS